MSTSNHLRPVENRIEALIRGRCASVPPSDILNIALSPLCLFGSGKRYPFWLRNKGRVRCLSTAHYNVWTAALTKRTTNIETRNRPSIRISEVHIFPEWSILNHVPVPLIVYLNYSQTESQILNHRTPGSALVDLRRSYGRTRFNFSWLLN